jgi:GNAT superfamily N-acetyltransferase
VALSLTTIAARPDLAETVAGWLWEEWGRKKGRPFEGVLARVSSRTALIGLEQCVVLLDGDTPAATASLVVEDADSRPDLSPWLASVFVSPTARGRGYGRVVVTAIESAAREAAIPTLWLFTDSAAPLYASLGWREAGPLTENGKTYALMRRDFAGR